MGWDDNGLPTERRVQNYYGVRCDPSLPYDPSFAAAGEARQGPGADLAAQLRRAVRAADRGGRGGVRGALAPGRAVGRLVATSTRRSRSPRAPPPSGRSCATWPAGRPTRRRRRPCGTSRSAPRSPRPSSRTASVPGAYHRISFHGARRRRSSHRDHPARAAAGLRRAGRPPRRRALPGAVRQRRCARRCSASSVPVVAHRLAEPDKGSGIAMICTFGDLTDVTWWRELRAAHPGDRRPGRPDPRRAARAGSCRARARTTSWPARP